LADEGLGQRPGVVGLLGRLPRLREPFLIEDLALFQEFDELVRCGDGHDPA